ncbi:ATP-binding cassette domain-containing protein [Fusibacter sp. A1]|nr:ATP-binding cassette domain-containing protein [Fusibacter sp. A1]
MAASLTRLDDFLDSLSSGEFDDKACVGPITEVSFKEVSYKLGAQTILHPISFRAQKGDIVGIRGKNGSGKSTLSYFINGLLSHDGIFLNQMPAKQFSTASHIGRVSSVLKEHILENEEDQN